ncbi:phosphoribosyltransferase [Legionella brunensis]|uniref:Hypoxanthine-guanine phosphoribosyltransferase n=1 Tax=Legionella brunensis TaxID=29422 RepID=A0A0W0S4Q8_9GAMM|nr:phosphoribosyltransferase family protein [Legionella brunensis]KTC78171.1 hypoxanthine-guanine phosphoribosyltransferase [Legionella brunensis]
MKEVILKQLSTIHGLKSTVTKRVWDHAHPVREIDLDKFDQKGDELTEDNIQKRTELLANRLIKEYPDANPVLIGLMDGALPFASLLQTKLNEKGYQYSYTTMQASSYGNKTTTSGELKIASMPKIPLGGRTVFVIDDVCDTGNTYLKIRELLESFGPKKISLVVLVDKVQKRVDNYMPEYVVFEVPSTAFIVGMGLDYFGELRNKLEIRAVDPLSLPNEQELELLNSEASLNEQLRKEIALEKTARPGSSNITIFGGSLEQSIKPDALEDQQVITTTYQ